MVTYFVGLITRFCSLGPTVFDPEPFGGEPLGYEPLGHELEAEWLEAEWLRSKAQAPSEPRGARRGPPVTAEQTS